MADYRENVLPVINQNFISDKSTNKEWLNVLQITQHHKLFGTQKSNSLQTILGSINKRINSTRQRLQGLVLLGQLVKQCNTDIFVTNAQSWLQTLIRTLQSAQSIAVLTAACHVCSDIVAQSKNFSELSREITSTSIPHLLPILTEAEPKWRTAAVSCINTCIQSFSGAVGPFKGKVFSVVISELDKTDTCQETIRCYALLTRCGGSGNQGIKYTESWSKQCLTLVSSQQQTLTALYEGLESESQSLSGAPLPLREVTEFGLDRVTALVARWEVLCKCMEALLRETFPAPAKVPVDAILQLISRCVTINNNTLLSRPTTERLMLALYLPRIHVSALACLQQLMICCRSLLLPQCTLINGLFSQELLWTSMSTSQSAQERPLSDLRQCIYNVLTVWMKVMGSACCVQMEEKTIVKQIIHDSSYHVEVMKLEGKVVSSKTDGQGTTKKKKTTGYQEITQGISTQRKVNRHANSELTTAALEALYWMLTSCGSELSAKSLQDIQKFSITTLLSLQQLEGGVFPAPYGAAPCRQALYHVLQASTLVPHSKVPAPLQCALSILTAGLKDCNLAVSSLCMEAVRLVETLIHPRAPCLNGPIICESLISTGTQPEAIASRKPAEAGDNLSVGGHMHQQDKDIDMDIEEVAPLSWQQERQLNTDKGTTQSSGEKKLGFSKRPVVETISASSSSSEVSEVGMKRNVENECAADYTNSAKRIRTENIVSLSSKVGEDSITIRSDDEDNDDSDEDSNDNEDVSSLVVNKDTPVTTDTVNLDSDAESGQSTTEIAGPSGEGLPIEVSSDEESDSPAGLNKTTEKPDDKEVEAMLLTFVDAEPDSD